MKSHLEDALRGRSLKQDIQSTLNQNSFKDMSKFLNKRGMGNSRFVAFNSHHRFTRSQIASPAFDNNVKSHQNSLSSPSFVKSDPKSKSSHRFLVTHVADETIKNNQKSKKKKIKSRKNLVKCEKIGFQTQRRARKRQNQHSFCLSNSRKRYGSPQTNKSQNKSFSGKGSSSSSRKHVHSASQDALLSKIHLSSIVQQQSSEDYPHLKQNSKKSYKRSQKEHQRGVFRQQERGLNDVVKKRLWKSIKQPEKFLRIVKNQCVNIRMRIQRRTILQFQIHALQNINFMKICLLANNLECQNIDQTFSDVKAHSKIYLFSAVRHLDLENLYLLPKLQIYIQQNEKVPEISRKVTIPYTWLHFSCPPSGQLRKTRIQTKICLQKIKILNANLRMLSLVLPEWHSRSNRGQIMLQSTFGLGENEFELILSESSGLWSISLGGRGQQRMMRMVSFLCEFLA